MHDNDVKVYSIPSDGASVFAERFIWTLLTKIYKYMTGVTKSFKMNKLDKTIDKYNNTYKAIKMKLVNVQQGTYIYYSAEHKVKDPKFEVGDHARISKYK